MARKRFTAAEKIAYVESAAIEYRNGSHWHPARIVGPIATDSIGNLYLPVRVTVTTKTISPGFLIHASPTSVRLVA